MPIESFPFNNRVVYEAGWREMAENWRTSGILVQGNVMDRIGGDCAVEPAGTGLEIRIAPGRAWVRGHLFKHTDDYEYLPISPNTSGSTRNDLVVIRLLVSDIANENRIQYTILEGTTTPVRNDTFWDLPLAIISVPDDASTITDDNITDLRVSSNQYGFVPGVQLTYGLARNFGSNATQTLTWSIEQFNNMGMFSTTQPDRITIKEPGIYFVQTMLYWQRTSANSIGGQMEASIYQVSGGTERQFVRDTRYISSSNGVQSVSHVVNCAAGDYLYVTATNGTAHTDVVINAAHPYSPYFSAIKLGTVGGL